MSFFLYGAYGYTGRLVAQRAVAREHRPILGGRDPDALSEVADALDLPSRPVSLTDFRALQAALSDVPAVLHCAGPFAETAQPMVNACLATGTHYLDITGEIDVFSTLMQRDREAADADISLLPGVGFDVVPTDCLAAQLRNETSAVDTLEIGVMSTAGWSGGTLKTALAQLGRGGLVRRNGTLRRVPPGWATRTVDFGDHPRTVISIPWGDLVTSSHSVGAPNVTTYVALPRLERRLLRLSRHVQGLLSSTPVQTLLHRLIDAIAPAPTDEARRQGRSAAWAAVRSRDGTRRSGCLEGPEAYTLTARAAVAAVERLLEAPPSSGYHTPATAFGPSFATTVEGVRRIDG